jgi:hypothetical protein
MKHWSDRIRGKAFNQVRFQFSKLDYSGKSKLKVLNFANVIDTNKLFQINRKFRVPRKQGAHFLGARDSWVFSSTA